MGAEQSAQKALSGASAGPRGAGGGLLRGQTASQEEQQGAQEDSRLFAADRFRLEPDSAGAGRQQDAQGGQDGGQGQAWQRRRRRPPEGQRSAPHAASGQIKESV